MKKALCPFAVLMLLSWVVSVPPVRQAAAALRSTEERAAVVLARTLLVTTGVGAAVTAPEKTGAYDVRYIINQDRKILAADPVTVR